MIPLHEVFFPRFRDWVRQDLPRVPDTTPVWAAFRQHSELSEPEARAALGRDSDPTVFVADIGVLDGKWMPSKPSTVYVSDRIVSAFEQAPSSAPARQKIESTVLHEMVHWAWRGRVEPEEKGRAFERDAYQAIHTRELVPDVAEGFDALGSLSRTWESNGDPAAIGRDRNGGWSFGLYQIASRVGTMGAFLRFLRERAALRPFHRALEDAGGEAAAKAGTARFQQEWRQLAEDPAFAEAQHEFIKHTHYDPYVAGLARRGIVLQGRSNVLHDVAWSTSVQHGPGAFSIFLRPWGALSDDARSDDERLIRGVYRERSRTDVHFPSSNAATRASVRARFERELAAALAMLPT